jgi:hypothetical protein
VTFFKDKNIPILQDQFLKKIESLLTFAEYKVTKKTEHRITIFLEAKNAEKKA